VIILPRMITRLALRYLFLRRAVALTGALMLGACATLSQDDARSELARAERAFARDSVDHGIRDAFIAHFAPDGLVFEPQPTRVREVWPARPAAAPPQTVQLDWSPRLVHVARAADLGLSTGPFRLVDTTGRQPPVEGAFLSVWQRQTDGAWKVWLDIGARNTGALTDAAWHGAPAVPARAQETAAPTASAVSALDHELSGLDAAAFAARLAVDARHYRDGAPVLVGTAWGDTLSAARATATYEPSEARVSASGDLAASYGRVSENGAAAPPSSGYYVHVWVRDGGAWWLAAEAVVNAR
jgi:ketosteroid isomerase-like protein